MTTIAPAKPLETQFVDSLRTRYEEQGFDFEFQPNPDNLPDFLGSYTPDAIARKPGQNIAIELKERSTSAEQTSLRRVRKLFEGRPDWRFDVVFMGAAQRQQISIPPASPGMLRVRIDEVRSLVREGQLRAAFVMAWSLLEAALHSTASDTSNTPHTPGSVLQALAMNGYIEPEREQQMRSLIDLRNRIVHGDVEAEPGAADVELVLSAVAETVGPNAA